MFEPSRSVILVMQQSNGLERQHAPRATTVSDNIAIDVDIDQASATHEHPRRGRLSRCPQYRVWVVAYAVPAVREWPSTHGSGGIATAGRNRQAGAAP